MKLQNYTIEISNVVKPVEDVPSNCNSIEFINKGAAVISVEEFPLGQNESISFGGNYGEKCIRSFKIKGNTLAKLYVIRKIYVG